MLECVSSGYCANVAEVYHGSGTRSQSVSGLAECVPGALSASVGRSAMGELWREATPSHQLAVGQSGRTRRRRVIVPQFSASSRLRRQVDYVTESSTAARAMQPLSCHFVGE